MLLLLFSCRKALVIGGGPDVEPDMKIRYVDSAGNDLFSPSHDGQNGYWMDSVRLYDYENGVKTLIYMVSTADRIYSYPYGYTFTTYSNVSNIQGEYLIVYANNDVVKRYSNTIIQLKGTVFDTLRVHLTGDVPLGSEYDSIWYNSRYLPGKDTLFTIVK